MKKFVTESAQQTMNIAEKYAKECSKGTVIAFFGGLGLGKTTFTKGFAKGLGVTNDITSPTFSIVNEYRTDTLNLYHFDMYKVESWEDLYSVGYFDYLDGNNILIIEWSENVENALPDNTVYIRIIKGESDNERIIYIGGEEVLDDSVLA